MKTDSFPKPSDFKFKPRTIAILAYSGVEALDITGPYEVFNFANRRLMDQGLCQEYVYTIKILADAPGLITTLSGMQIVADEAYGDPFAQFDTLLIPGGGIDKELANRDLLDWLTAMSTRVRRLGSVCTGAFIMAEAGLLNGCQATTHWSYCQQLANQYPKVKVKPNRIFIKQGKIFTAGGITSGIDLALALLEEDFGRELALYVAKFLVFFLKRPGGQSQFSTFLTHEVGTRHDIRELQSWISSHIEDDLYVEDLAERMAMSTRNFARLFLAETGMTPAKFVEMARLDHARQYLESTDLPIDTVADKTGFKDPERMRRSFIRQLGVNPQNYRQRFSGSIPVP